MNISSQKKSILTRTFFALILIVVFTPFLVIAKYAGVPGRIISSIFYICVGMLGYFELLRLFKFSRTTSYLTILVIPVFILVNFDMYKTIVLYGISYNFNNVMYDQFMNWKILLVSTVFVIIPPISEYILHGKKTTIFRFLIIMLMSFILPIFVKSLWLINVNSMAYIAFFIGIAIVSDTSAYIGGMFFGKKWFKGAKFSPNISPKKTWAGYVISVVVTIIYTTLVGYYTNVWHSSYVSSILISAVFAVVVSLVGPYGDLLFSLIKRKEGVKDFSNLIPEHGGVFDRVDTMSLIFTIITMTYLII